MASEDLKIGFELKVTEDEDGCESQIQIASDDLPVDDQADEGFVWLRCYILNILPFLSNLIVKKWPTRQPKSEMAFGV